LDRGQEQALIDSIEFFRALGFFRQFADMTTVEILDRVKRRQEDAWEEPFDELIETFDIEVPGIEADLMLLELDDQRVLFDSPDPDYWDDNVPSQVLEMLSDVSRGVFAPQNIAQQYDYGSSPTIIEFDWNGTHHVIEENPFFNCMTVSLIGQVNAIIGQGRGQFEVPAVADITHIMLLTQQEKQQLIDERGWTFNDLTR
jgi:hypothetical protein